MKRRNSGGHGYRARNFGGMFNPSLVAAAVNAGRRMYSSYTKTKTRRRKGPDGGSGSTGDMNKVIYQHKKQSKGKRKAFKKFKAKVDKALESTFPLERIVLQNSRSMTWLTGKQAYDSIPLLDVDNLRAMTAILDNRASSQAQYTERFRVLRSRIDGYYSNAGNTLAIIDWYECVPRADNVNNPYYDFQQAGQNVRNSGGEVVNLATNAFQGAQASDVTVGITPFVFSQFCTKWLILNKRRVMLQPGETKEFRFVDSRARDIEGSRFQQAGTPYKAIRGITKYQFFIVYGQPCHDSTSKSNISTTPGRVDFAFTTTYHIRATHNADLNQGESAPTSTFMGSVFSSVTTPVTVEEFNPSAVITGTSN